MGNDYEAIKTEWDLASDKDPTSFKVNRMMVCTDQLLQIKVTTNVRKISPQEHEVNVNGRNKALVWSLKQFYTCSHWLYEKGTTLTMVSLQGLHPGNALKCASISAGVGLKLFCPWCLKVGGNMEMITVHLKEGYYQMSVACDICWAFASMTIQNIQAHWSECKGKHNIEHAECDACEAHGKAQRSQDSKKELKSCKSKKTSKSHGQNGSSESHRSDECGSTRDGAKKTC